MTQITAIQAAPANPPIEGVRLDARLDIVVHDTMAAAEAAWRSLETHGVLTPYQRYDWVAALLAAGAEPAGRVAVAVVSDMDRPVAVLPLLVEHRYGVVRARMLGGHQSNSDWILSAPQFQPTPADLRCIFDQLARAAGGIDLISFLSQPRVWQGVANPVLALPHSPGPSNLYATAIGGTPVPYVEHRLTTKRRSNINRGRRRLEEQFGPVRLVRVDDAATLDLVQATFIEQRGARFDAMGVDNIFAKAPFTHFFRALSIASFGETRPALCVHALLAGDEIVATSWGATAGNHYSQYINSTSAGPAARYSLSGILVAELMDQLLEAGIETFDMGLGDFDYKVEWTDPQPVFDSLIPLTLKGHIAAGITKQRGALKRLIKQTPAFWNAAKATRRYVFNLRRR
ncbi:Acetyltransferase involved in cellulose biosynthesis, CelD/BcsL family [Devosia sp. YR412]|uniref:GNAT family N-acetyltransferase n=1 Tax=Devosia sp. YR412 TaxID=1881030 RepID=UPI0008CFB01B|nr:GNAT family N-acetyltransferase [Devosia sp. YR412]SEQ25192.1 Acetyltransferase involved in cellulose biosynthesis, CelD/BcsL family [Devosia sp. YR412]